MHVYESTRLYMYISKTNILSTQYKMYHLWGHWWLSWLNDHLLVSLRS